MIYIAGPGHGGPALVANTYLEGTYSEVYPDISQDDARAAAAVQAVLVSGRHSEPRRAGDARLDPRRRRARLFAVACVRRGVRQSRSDRRLRRRRRRSGDRAARDELALEQVPESGARRRGAADPASERLQDRQPDGARAHSARRADAAAPRLRLRAVLRRRRRSEAMHQLMARTLDTHRRPRFARFSRTRAATAFSARPRWPMIVLRTPKGWTGPKEVDGKPVEGTLRSHQVPLAELAQSPSICACSRTGCRAIGPKSCSTSDGKLRPELARACAAGQAAHGRQSARQRRHAAARSAPAGFPRLRGRRCRSPAPSTPKRRASQGDFLRDVMKLNLPTQNFRVFSPDETASNRWTPSSKSPTRCRSPRSRPPTIARRARRPRDGDAERASVPGLARRLSAHRPARLLLAATRRSSTSSTRCSTSTPSG